MESKRHNPMAQMVQTFGYMGLWITLSATVIMINKYILDPKMGNFPFPLTLTCIHMAFCSILSWALVKVGYVQQVTMPMNTYLSCVLPVGGLFAAVLWLGNAAYLYLSVSFIQMLKAMMPMLVYLTSLVFNVDKPCGKTFLNMGLVVLGVFIASYGEVVFHLLGVICQVSSCVAEAVRLTLVQILLQRRGIKLNPVTTMCYVAPACLVFLLVPFAFVEAGQVLAFSESKIGPGMLLLSAASAFALNCAVFLLIGKSSALTMNIAGVIKDLLLIGLSVSLYKSIVTSTQMSGYILALAGVFYYNYMKIKAAQAAAAAAAEPEAGKGKGVGDVEIDDRDQNEHAPLLKDSGSKESMSK